MKNTYRSIILLSFIFFCTIMSSTAQIIVDGDLADWGDSTKFKYDDQNKLWYNFKKDDQFLYVAIKKNQNASKFMGGGIQLSFSSKGIDTNSLQITFAHSLIDPTSNQRIKYSHDYFQLNNYEGIKDQLLSKYNETGILIEWKYSDISYFPKKSRVNAAEVPANPNIFTAELQIPLMNLQKNIGNIIHYTLCLRGSDLGKKGENNLKSRNLFVPNNAYNTEMFEKMYFTEFFGILDLTSI